MSGLAYVADGAAPLRAVSAPDGILAEVGNTPLVQLKRITAGRLAPGVEIWAKLEWFNPSGSVKARAAAGIILEAEASGALGGGKILLDSSSGNTGIAYAMMGAARGHRVCLCLPANANIERKRTLLAYGAELILTDPMEGSDGAMLRARAMAKEAPERYFFADQYSNDANWRAHFEGTGPEIWRDTAGRATHFVAGLGTSGTFVGTTRYLKSVSPELHAYTVEPDGPFHGLEGLKHMASAMVPAIYRPEGLVTEHIGAPTEAALNLTRRLAREEGLLVGPSSGAALWGALHVAETLRSGVVVVLFPDSGGRYLSEAHIWGEQT